MQTKCSIPDCDRMATIRGWCFRHYSRWYRRGDPLTVLKRGSPPRLIPCSVIGCTGIANAKGFCRMHYARWKTHGDALTVRQIKGDHIKRFWSYVRKSDECWTWTGALDVAGYAGFWNGMRTVRAHRYGYEMLVGPIADGMEIDHLCHNTSCVNPAHLEAVTPKVNSQRRRPRGHPKPSAATGAPPAGSVAGECI